MKDWDACYQKEDTPWDKGSAAPPLLEVIERLGAGVFGEGPVLVPGCGLGHDVRVLAKLGLSVMGLDISATAVEKARMQPASGAETYEVGDFLSPGWREGRRFTAIWEHTCFCAIAPALRGSYAEAVAALLPPGGMLVGVFFITPNDPGEDESGPPFQVSTAELDTWFGPWFERIEGWVPERAYVGREGREWLAVFRKRP
jgi:SAM-dependent methyltransferase